MNAQQFANLDDALMRRAGEVLLQRMTAYATPEEQLQNFKDVAMHAGITPQQVWLCFMAKGMRVVERLMRGESAPGETVEERFVDAINYLRLGYALLHERGELASLKEQITDGFDRMSRMEREQRKAEERRALAAKQQFLKPTPYGGDAADCTPDAPGVPHADFYLPPVTDEPNDKP